MKHTRLLIMILVLITVCFTACLRNVEDDVLDNKDDNISHNTILCTHQFTEASCEKPRNCILCGKTEGNPHGHSEVIDHSIEATCTTKGLSEGVHCSICNKVLIPQIETEKIEHKFTHYAAQSPSCYSNGWNEYDVCYLCGHSTYSEIPKIEHNYSEWITTCNATCDTKGMQTRSCIYCKNIESKEIAATGHSYSIASCTQPQTCLKCGVIGENAIGHKWKDATCTTPQICTECNMTNGNPLEHYYEEWIIETDATCTYNGEKYRMCSYCQTKEIETIPVLSHDYFSIVTPPTCTEDGYTTYVCSCGDNYMSDYVNASHTIVIDEAIPPTSTSNGLTEGSHCSVCGEVLVKQKVVNKTIEYFYTNEINIDWDYRTGITYSGDDIYCDYQIVSASCDAKRDSYIINAEHSEDECLFALSIRVKCKTALRYMKIPYVIRNSSGQIIASGSIVDLHSSTGSYTKNSTYTLSTNVYFPMVAGTYIIQLGAS